MNFQRASGRIQRKVDELLCQMEAKTKGYELWEKKLETNKEDLEEIVFGYKQHIIGCMNELRQKIDLKQEELLKKAEEVQNAKFNELGTVRAEIGNLKKEIQDIRDIIQTQMKDLDEVSTCQYYALKEDLIKGFLEEQAKFSSAQLEELIEGKDIQQQISIENFNRDFEDILAKLENFRSIESVSLLKRIDDHGDLTNRAQVQSELADIVHLEPLHHPRNGLVQNLDKIFRGATTKTPSPIKKASSYYTSLPHGLTQNTEESAGNDRQLAFQARSQNIYNNLDKIFGAKNRRNQNNHGLLSRGSQEKLSLFPTQESREITLPQKDSIALGIEEVLRADYSRRKSPSKNPTKLDLPVGHAPFYEKRKVLRSSFISDFNHLKLDNIEAISSPKGNGSGSVRLSVLSPRDSKKGYLRSSLEGTQLEGLLTMRATRVSDRGAGYSKSTRNLGLKIGSFKGSSLLDSSKKSNPSFLTRNLRDNKI